MAKDRSVWADVAVVIPTFRRNEELIRALKAVDEQLVVPGIVLIIDNNPTGLAKPIVNSYNSNRGIKIEYISMDRNTGPAGAFAAAFLYLLDHPAKPEWMACRDDDLPFEQPDDLARLKAMADAAPLTAAGVGTWGTHHFPLNQIPDVGPFAVDVIPGGGEPIYRIAAFSRAGINFNENLFFGFEELDIGLRIRKAGMLLLAGQVMPDTHVTGERRLANWRTYFGERNWLLICREFEPFHRFLFFAMRAFGVSVKRWLQGGRPGEATAMFYGAIDGIRGGKPRRTYIP